MLKKVKKGILILLGIIFLVLGLIGLLLPVVPQIPFLLIGLACLTSGSEKLKSRIEKNKIYKRFANGGRIAIKYREKQEGK